MAEQLQARKICAGIIGIWCAFSQLMMLRRSLAQWTIAACMLGWW